MQDSCPKGKRGVPEEPLILRILQDVLGTRASPEDLEAGISTFYQLGSLIESQQQSLSRPADTERAPYLQVDLCPRAAAADSEMLSLNGCNEMSVEFRREASGYVCKVEIAAEHAPDQLAKVTFMSGGDEVQVVIALPFLSDDTMMFRGQIHLNVDGLELIDALLERSVIKVLAEPFRLDYVIADEETKQMLELGRRAMCDRLADGIYEAAFYRLQEHGTEDGS
ncbi:MAG: hypothetical protein ACYTHJ_06585 [Planctomycetota bacterium]|jgi:hypothetical protein